MIGIGTTTVAFCSGKKRGDLSQGGTLTFRPQRLMDLKQHCTPEGRLFWHREEGQMPWCFILSFERLNLGLPLPSNLPGPPQSNDHL